MSSNSLVILICGVVAMIVLVVLIVFLGSRKKARRAGTSHTTQPGATRPTTDRTSRPREES